MKALKIEQPNQTAIMELPIPEPAPNEVLIKVMASGICGTDIHILRGDYLGDYPVIPGHEFSGIVEIFSRISLICPAVKPGLDVYAPTSSLETSDKETVFAFEADR